MKQFIHAAIRSACGGIAALSLLVLAGSTGCDSRPPANALAFWKPFSPPGGNFSVTMPPNPIVETPKTSTGFEAKTYRIVSAMSNLAGLAVSYSDQPPTASFQKDAKKVLDSVKKQAVSDLRGELISEKAISHKGYPGIEFQASVKGGFTVRQRIFLANRRLYSLMVIAGSRGLESPEAKTFFDSFQILK
ncbi:MAG: hypothetical protein HY735_04585 [Verrucomicrobia bacterium]|nr:hypothetical protein [Verrucomicrobiota bacterium]